MGQVGLQRQSSDFVNTFCSFKLEQVQFLSMIHLTLSVSNVCIFMKDFEINLEINSYELKARIVSLSHVPDLIRTN